MKKEIGKTLFVALVAFAGLARADFLGPEGEAIHAFRNSAAVQNEVAAQAKAQGLEPGEISALKVFETYSLPFAGGVEYESLYFVSQSLGAPKGAIHPNSTSVIAGVKVVRGEGYSEASEPQLVGIGEFYLTALYTGILTEKSDQELLTVAFDRAHEIASKPYIEEVAEFGYEPVGTKSQVLTTSSGRGGYSQLVLVSTELANPSAFIPTTHYVNGIYIKDHNGKFIRGAVFEDDHIVNLLSR